MFKINHFKVNSIILLAERIETLHGLLRSFGLSVLVLRRTVPLTYTCIIFILIFILDHYGENTGEAFAVSHAAGQCAQTMCRINTAECEIPLTNTTRTLTLMPLQQGVRCQECFIINHTPLPHTPPPLM